MKKKQKTIILSSLGLIIIAGSQILTRYVELNDLSKGLLIGTGIGLLLVLISKYSFIQFKKG